DKIIARTEKQLKDAYDLDVIYPDFRNLTCIVLLNKYFQSGMCTTLEGHEGAYILLKNDLQMNRIIANTDDLLAEMKGMRGDLKTGMGRINNALSSIMSTSSKIIQLAEANNEIQGNIQQSINGLNSSVNDGIDTLNKINDNAELLAYQQERIAREVEYANSINYLAGRNYHGNNQVPPSFYR
ncbi:MAG: hypothetical protein IKY04_08935, partial [Lachnospiraceae bacterium]|nr:hypothetical protein [Lachnospiraceae bacterium]